MRSISLAAAAFACIPLSARAEPVNAIAGDASFVERFGRMPEEGDDRDPNLRNRHYPTRRPHFEDEQGRLCAVGHLIAITADAPREPGRCSRFDAAVREP
jgi:hypothetical protein